MTDTGARPLVLLVEDDRDSRDMYAMGLDMFGLRVAVADTAGEALRAFARERPDIVVTDLTLPDMDGLALCEALTREPGTAVVPVVALTGRSDDADLSRAAAAGVLRVIVKPCAPDALADAIRAVLSA
jgi:DNA-binding response OmpR family regulator